MNNKKELTEEDSTVEGVLKVAKILTDYFLKMEKFTCLGDANHAHVHQPTTIRIP